MLKDGVTNTFGFLHYLRSLCNKLGQDDSDWRSKVILMMDNASTHTSKESRAFIKAYNVPVFYTTPYHPELNPVESCFSLLKSSISVERP